MTNFNSTISSNKSIGRLVPAGGLDSNRDNTIFPSGQNQMTLTGDYDTYIMSTANVSLKQMSRASSQGRITQNTKKFDVKNLLLPEISQGRRLKIEKSRLSNILSSSMLDL